MIDVQVFISLEIMPSAHKTQVKFGGGECILWAGKYGISLFFFIFFDISCSSLCKGTTDGRYSVFSLTNMFLLLFSQIFIYSWEEDDLKMMIKVAANTV